MPKITEADLEIVQTSTTLSTCYKKLKKLLPRQNEKDVENLLNDAIQYSTLSSKEKKVPPPGTLKLQSGKVRWKNIPSATFKMGFFRRINSLT